MIQKRKWLRLAAVFALSAGALMAQEDRIYQNSDIRGSYAFTFSGWVVQGPQTIAVAAIGRLTSDGNGRFTSATRSFSFGGQIFEQKFTGTYQVAADGTGTSEFVLVSQTPAGPPVKEKFSFVMTDRKGGEIVALATSITGPNGENLNFAAVIAARVIAQK